MIPSKEELNHALKMRHGEALHTRISTAVIAVCGLGGLGSNIAVSLARAGVGKLILIDFDQVDVSNLHRQQYKASQVGLDKTQALSQNLWEISPYIDLETHTVRIADEDDVRKLLSSADIICEAFDHAEAKSMLTNAVLELLPDKYLIAASGMAGLGSANARLPAVFIYAATGSATPMKVLGLWLRASCFVQPTRRRWRFAFWLTNLNLNNTS